MRHLAAGFRRTEPVDDHHLGQVIEELVLERRRQRSTARHQDVEARNVVVAAVELVEERTRERIADDEEEGHLFTLDHRPHVDRVESTRDRLHENDAAADPRSEGHPVRSAVHEGRGRERAKPGVRRFEETCDVGRRSRAVEAFDDGVAVSPHHTFRHAGRATGVENVEVVRAPLHVRSLRTAGCQRIVVPDRSRQQDVARFVGHLDDRSQPGEFREDLGQRGREFGVDDDRGGARVTEQVPQLFGDVSVVHIERCDARLPCSEHRFEVFVAVVEVDRKMILTGFVQVEFMTFAVAFVSTVGQEVGEPSGSIGDLRPGEPAVAVYETELVGSRGGNGFMERREAHLAHGAEHRQGRLGPTNLA